MSVKGSLNKTLYMPSTPLNILVSSALAIHKGKQNSGEEIAQVWLIDQKNIDNNPYVSALKKWSGSPFEKVKIFSGSNKEQNKLKQRRKVFKELKAGLSSFSPNEVAVGSDRRVEFQYVMHLLSSTKVQVSGLYLDDGLYSYAGRIHHFIKDGINALLKKIAYGLWWREPKSVGASSWIDQAWLFAPHQSIEVLKEKQSKQLLPEWFIAPEILDLSYLVAQELKYDVTNLAELDIVILLPHPNNIKKMQGYEKRIQSLVKALSEQGKYIGVKYHPRTNSEDPLHLTSAGAKEVLPSLMAFEFCLPLFNKKCQVVGDIGTALFTCKWLRPDLKVTAVLDENDAFQQRFISISHSMGINVTNQYEAIVKC
ncbi:polysialyltransferase family glycosyltransferase [Thiomicrorhabdus lithotrophica]|uniref:Alpha-2,8-polysialyltransferase family protein n=1 Tax=Thiomicrorhabdus lithotrophica TaxID=2949997 RepID=A0ABY8CCK6_9GAMM|nr:polysialyltransferase family glycosyltransferase [Thiomicrorhabdus lithotrophica]WEJ62128.1 alpha-2,8-polysialyltransferase family protein [Thiomicrorhabdus lithotrophica]